MGYPCKMVNGHILLRFALLFLYFYYDIVRSMGENDNRKYFMIFRGD